MLDIALPKGRLGDTVYERFARAGYPCPSYREDNRKLVLEAPEIGVRYLLVKPADVSIYVEHGAADLGVVGKDILLETESDVCELIDLHVGVCRLAIAAKEGYIEDRDAPLRVATKYANVTRAYYTSRNREIDLIHLNGSIELAPILGLSDVILDIVETGKTLRENHLCVIDTVCPVSARLIANRSSYMFQYDAIRQLVDALQREANV